MSSKEQSLQRQTVGSVVTITPCEGSVGGKPEPVTRDTWRPYQQSNHLKNPTFPCPLLLAACLALTLLPAAAQNPPYTVTDIGPFYRVLQRTVSVTNSLTGQVAEQVEGWTPRLGEGLNYWTNGQWAESQDLIEVKQLGRSRSMARLRPHSAGTLPARGPFPSPLRRAWFFSPIQSVFTTPTPSRAGSHSDRLRPVQRGPAFTRPTSSSLPTCSRA